MSDSERPVMESPPPALKRVLDAVPAAVVLMDAAGRVRLWNQGAEELFGFTAREIGGQVLPLVPLEEGVGFRAKLETVMAGGTLRGVELHRVRKDGQEVEVRLWASPWRGEGGAVEGVVAAYVDMTELRRLERQFQQAQRLEILSRLASGIAHDFNNLLTVISGYSGMLLAKLEGDAAACSTVEAIRQAGERASALVRQLLASSRQLPFEPRLVDLNVIVEDLRRVLERVIGENITVEVELDPSLPALLADQVQLSQTLFNLAVNAREAMPGGGRLRIRTRSVLLQEERAARVGMQSGQYACLEVADTGTGMSEETRARAFEPFFTTKHDGSGLGLAAVQGIVRQHHGGIEMESEPGMGTTFRLFFPCPAESRVEEGSLTIPLGHGEKVLVVEDEPNVRLLLLEILEGCGYAVRVAAKASEALADESLTHGVDVLVTDMVLPDMDGCSLAQLVRRKQPRAGVLLVSGYVERGPCGQLDPPYDFLNKPFTLGELAGKVATLAAGRPKAAE
jgi:two-component system cell cycle sensor histidine kinase/response regulator CckA